MGTWFRTTGFRWILKKTYGSQNIKSMYRRGFGRSRGNGHDHRNRRQWDEDTDGSWRDRNRGGNRREQSNYSDSRHGDHHGSGGGAEGGADSYHGNRSWKKHVPRGLRGREIGMFFARRSNSRKAEMEEKMRPVVALDGDQEKKIQNLLTNIRSGGSKNSLRPTSSTQQDWFDQDSVQAGTSYKTNTDFTEHSNEWSQSFRTKSEPVSDNFEEGDVKGSKVFHRPATSSGLIKKELTGFSSTASLESVEDSGLEEGLRYPNQISDMKELMEEKIQGEFIYDQGDLSVSDFGKEYKTENNPELDMSLKAEFEQKMTHPGYRKMMEFRQKLPSYERRKELLDLLEHNQCVVVSGETGCGKTTQVPQYILDDYLERGMGSQCHVICTQPRRISAISVAERVAAERNEKCGHSSGYIIRLEKNVPRARGSVVFCTTGILLKNLESDPCLMQASHIILDEIHERDLLSDFMMIILKGVLRRRPELKLILMSATINAEAFSQYFYNCPMMEIPGFTYPVKEYLLEDVVEMLGYEVSEKASREKRSRKWSDYRRTRMEAENEERDLQVWLRNLDYSQRTVQTLENMHYKKLDADLIVSLIDYISRTKSDGAILVFVPGWGEISDIHKKLMANDYFNSSKFLIIPLHSMMPTLNQKQVFDRPPPGVRKIIIATNIAETSITIDDVVYVIDSGKIKVTDFEPETNVTSLAPQWVSLANARQRKGRAGRVQAGECYHLYSSFHKTSFNSFLKPEMLRTPLEELCLQIKLLKLGRIEPFVMQAMEPPSENALKRAIENLQDMNALDADENLLPLGYHLARIPLDPHTGKMILFGAMFGCLDPILTIAASLNFKDPFLTPLGKEEEVNRCKNVLADGCKSDHLLLVKVFKEWESLRDKRTQRDYCWQNFLSSSTVFLLGNMKTQLAGLLADIGFISTRSSKDPSCNVNSDNMALVRAVACAGLYPRVVRLKDLREGTRRRRPLQLLTKNGTKCELHKKSVNCFESVLDSQWLVYYNMLKTEGGLTVFDCSPVSPYSLLFFGRNISKGKDDVEGYVNVVIDNWIKFRALAKTANLVIELRQELDHLLERKMTNPAVTYWNEKSQDMELMKSIAELVTNEEPALPYRKNRSNLYNQRRQ